MADLEQPMDTTTSSEDCQPKLNSPGVGKDGARVPKATEASLKPTTTHVFALIVALILSITWGITMTALYLQEYNNKFDDQRPPEKDTIIRSDGSPLGITAISHINVVVNDSIDIGAEYYERVMGFKPAYNDGGKMEYRNITNYGFCLDAGFDEGKCRVDIIFLKHPVLNLYLELFYYYDPYQGKLDLPNFETNDVGGIRHIAVEVEDAVATYNELKGMSDHQGRFITQDTPVSLDPFPYVFFYFVDKYRIQWEFEQGRPVEYYHIAGITG